MDKTKDYKNIESIFEQSERICMNGKYPKINGQMQKLDGMIFRKSNDYQYKKKSYNNIVKYSPDTILRDFTFYDFSNYKSASIFPYVYDSDGEKVYFLGKEKRGWSDFGGSVEKTDISPKHTAIREYIEETRGKLPIPKNLVLFASQKGHYMFSGELQVDAETNNGIPDLYWLKDEECDYYIEKNSYGWVYAKDIYTTTKTQWKSSTLSVSGITENGMEVMFVIKNMANLLRGVGRNIF